MVFFKNGFHNRLPGQRVAGLWFCIAFILTLAIKIVDMETQHIAVFNGVGDGVGMQLFLEEIPGGFERFNFAFYLFVAGVGLKDRRAGETEELGFWEKFLDCPMVLTELGTVAFVKDKHDTLVA